MLGKRIAAEVPVSTIGNKRKADHDPEEDEYDDPFGAPPSSSLQKRSSVLSNSKPLSFTNSSKSSTMSSMCIGVKKISSISGARKGSRPSTGASTSFASPVSSTKLSPDDMLADSPTPQSATSPGLTSSLFSGAPPSSSASSPSPHHPHDHHQLHQSRIDLHYDETRASRAAKPAFKKQAEKLRTLNGTDITCRLCNAWLDDVTLADHARVCQKLPGPISFPSSCNCPASSRASGSMHAHDSTRCLLIPQYLGSYDAHSWGGSQLLRVTAAYQRNASQTEKKRIRRVMKWMRSILNSDEGRDLELDEEDEEDESIGNNANELDFVIQQGQELWIYTIRGGNKDQVACAVLISLDIDMNRIQLNEQVIKIKSHPNQKQTSLMGFLQQSMPSSSPSSVSPSPSSTTAAASSATKVISPASPLSASVIPSTSNLQNPIFGVDKIAVHSRFRFGASSSHKVSLAHHVLNSIVSFVQGREGFFLKSATATLPTHRVAFSTPTMAGARLASRFTNTQAFMTYAFKH